MVKLVTFAILIFTMQTAQNPKSICDSVDKYNRDFIQGDTDKKCKVHLINQKECCKPKSYGGLGLRSMRQLYVAILSKLRWRLIKDEGSVQANILKRKCFNNKSGLQVLSRKSGASDIQNGIVHGLDLLRMGCCQNVRNGKDVCFWKDVWLDNEALKNKALMEISNKDMEENTEEFWDKETGWQWNIF